MGNLVNDIIRIVAEKCVHPDSQRSFSIEDIRQAIKDIQFTVRQDRPAKAQALVCIKLLCQKFYIERAKMKIRINFDESEREGMINTIKQYELNIVQQDEKGSVVCIIEPSDFRIMFDVIKKLFQNSSIEVIENIVSNKEQEDINDIDKVELRIREEWIKEN